MFDIWRGREWHSREERRSPGVAMAVDRTVILVVFLLAISITRLCRWWCFPSGLLSLLIANVYGIIVIVIHCAGSEPINVWWSFTADQVLAYDMIRST